MSRPTDEEILDDLVHEAASTLASNAINAGDQREFLADACGWQPEEIDAEIREATGTP